MLLPHLLNVSKDAERPEANRQGLRATMAFLTRREGEPFMRLDVSRQLFYQQRVETTQERRGRVESTYVTMIFQT